MKRAEEIALLETCLESVKAGRPPATEQESLIPVEHYRDPERFLLERQVLFAEQLNVVGHACEVRRPGDFITREVSSQPVIVVRGDDGLLRAFLNVCRHRGAQVAREPRGHCKRFVCPYHAWTYRTDGTLAAARQGSGFPTLDQDESGLVALACHELAGLIWVCPDPARGDLDPGPGDRALAEELGSLLGRSTEAEGAVVFASAAKTYRANHKLIVDGGLESYHFKIAHRNTVAPFFADNVHHYASIGPHTRTVLPRVELIEAADAPRESWSIRKLAHLVYAIAPNATVLVQEGHFELIVSTARSVAETHIAIHTVVTAPGPDGFSDKAQAFWAANHAFTKATLEEDFVLAEQIQRGLQTGANTHFRFATFEGALTAWHRRLEERLTERRRNSSGRG